MRGALFALGISFALALFTVHPFAAAEIASAPASTVGGLSVQRFRPFYTRAYQPGDWFRVEYRVRNTGERPISDIEATVDFSNANLEAVVSGTGEKAPRTQRIGVLRPGEERYVFWLIDARRPGYTDINLKVSSSVGELESTFRVRVL